MWLKCQFCDQEWEWSHDVFLEGFNEDCFQVMFCPNPKCVKLSPMKISARVYRNYHQPFGAPKLKEETTQIRPP